MRQHRGARLLRAEHAVGRPRRRAAELLGRDPLDAAGDPGLLEDRLGEVGPGALALRGQVVDAERQARVDDLARGGSQVADVGGAAELVGDDAHLVALLGEAQHGAHEVGARPAEEPGGAQHPGVAAHQGCGLAAELRAAVDALRAGAVALDVRGALRPVEDVVGGVVDERLADRCHVLRAADVRDRGALRVVLGAVDVRPGGGVQHDVHLGQPDRRRQRHVPGVEVNPGDLVAGERLGERGAELAVRSGDQEAADRSLSLSVGSLVLHRSTTRGSFHGTPSSSGWAGSYSRVTW